MSRTTNKFLTAIGLFFGFVGSAAAQVPGMSLGNVPISGGFFVVPPTCTVASAATIDLPAAGCVNGSLVAITGSTNIDTIADDVPVGSQYMLDLINFSGFLGYTGNIANPGANLSNENGFGPYYVTAIYRTTNAWDLIPTASSHNVMGLNNGEVQGTDFYSLNPSNGQGVIFTGRNSDATYRFDVPSGAASSAGLPFLSGSSNDATMPSWGNFQDTTLPTIASGACGAGTNGTITSGGNGASFNVVIGSATTTACTISFGQTWPYAPHGCVAFPASSASAGATVLPYIAQADLSTTGLVLRGGALASTTFNIHCE